MDKDKKRFDIGIFGETISDDYGKIASYYALYNYISSLGKHVCIIPPLNDKMRVDKSKDFFKTHCNCLTKLRMNEYKLYNKIVDTFVIGSGPLWNDQFRRWRDHVYLGFVEEVGHKKIAYGTTYNSTYPTCLDRDPMSLKHYKNLLHKFDHVSHIDYQDCQISKKWFKLNETTIVVDPIFLTDRYNWDKIIDNVTCEVPYNNLLFYTEDPKISHLDIWHKISRSLDMNETLIITNNNHKRRLITDHSIILDNETPLNDLDNVDFGMWLKYIRDSKVIMTSSIYCVYFSILFRKNFIYISLNDTIPYIIDKLGLSHRVINGIDIDKIIDLCKSSIYWDEIHKNLDNMVEYSKTWLKKTLK